MSLGAALNMTMRGLMSTSSKIGVVSQNIMNADKPGYTRKEVQDIYQFAGTGSVPVRQTIVGSTDRYMTKALVGDVTETGKYAVISEVMDYYASQLGSTDGGVTIAGYLDLLYSTLQQLGASPETLANKSEFVQTASYLADTMRNLSGDIQDLRLQAENTISDSISSINENIKKIAAINANIQPGVTPSAQIAEYQDQQMIALEELATELDIQYYFNSNGQVQLFTGKGQNLLSGGQPAEFSHDASSYLNGEMSYPADINPIMLNGIDVTNMITGGRLAGAVELRDTILPQEQQKLDELANVLKDQMNKVLNTGSSLPPQTTLTGSESGLTAATPFSATGVVRIANVTNAGVLQGYTDVDLSAATNIGDLLTTLNATPNINASLNAQGQLVISSTLAGTGIAMNEMNSNVGGQGFSDSFGMQDLFIGNGAETIRISDAMNTTPNILPTGVLSSGAIAVGDNVIARGDGSVSKAMASLINTNVNFGAAGDFAAQSNSLNRYAQAFMSTAATKAMLAEDRFETANMTYTQTKSALENKSGVNVDEETTKMLELENQYQAAARVITTIRDLFDELVNAVR